MVKSMDKLERRLKEDAGHIKADLTPELRERIRASLESAEPVGHASKSGEVRGVSLWLASSLTGLAAALIIVLINRDGGVEMVEDVPDPVATETAWSMQDGFLLNAETAEWAAPLEEELRNLQSDLERARENVERDLRSSF
jgi:hypothetical protein